jgi:hypothetical protein
LEGIFNCDVDFALIIIEKLKHTESKAMSNEDQEEKDEEVEVPKIVWFN